MAFHHIRPLHESSPVLQFDFDDGRGVRSSGNSGIDFDFDFFGNLRGENPDIGAHEMSNIVFKNILYLPLLTK